MAWICLEIGSFNLPVPSCTTLQELNGHYIVLWQHIADASPGHLGNMMLSTSQDLNPIDPNRSKDFVKPCWKVLNVVAHKLYQLF